MRSGPGIPTLIVTAALTVAAYDVGRRRSVASLASVPTIPELIPTPPAPFVVHDSGPTIEQVQRLESLVVQRVDVADVCTTDIQGYLGGARAAILVRGDLVVAVDLGKAKFESKDADKRTATLVLPQPAVSRPRVDQEKTRLVELNRQGIWMIVPGDASQSAAVNQAYRHAQQVVGDAGTEPKLLEKARRNAEETLAVFFQALGWTIKVKWSDG